MCEHLSPASPSWPLHSQHGPCFRTSRNQPFHLYLSPHQDRCPSPDGTGILPVFRKMKALPRASTMSEFPHRIPPRVYSTVGILWFTLFQLLPVTCPKATSVSSVIFFNMVSDSHNHFPLHFFRLL